MKLNKRFRCALCAALAAACVAAPAAAWSAEKQDLTQVEVTVDPGVTSTPSSWAKSEVELAAQAGLIPRLTGNPGYQDDITREQFAELVTCLVEKVTGGQLTAAADGTFSDTSNAAVLKAAQAGIITGTGNGLFAPALTTNREQIAAMVYRAAQYLKEQTGKDLTPAAGSVDKFTDRDQISSWAVDGVGALAANSIMNGTSATTAGPQISCTVEQSILLLYRVYQLSI